MPPLYSPVSLPKDSTQRYYVGWVQREFEGPRTKIYSPNPAYQHMEKRYGWRVRCKKCRWRRHHAGEADLAKSNKAFLQAEEEHAKFCDGQLLVARSYHATEVTHAFTEQTTRQTTISTSYADITGASIASGSFTAGKDYLLIVTAQLDVSGASITSYIETLHGSTAFANSVYALPIGGSGIRVTYMWFTVWTAVASEGIKLQFKTESGTTGADVITLTAIKLSDDLVPNTDYYYDGETADTALTTTYASFATVTFTPASTGLNYLVLVTAQSDIDDTADSVLTRINVGDSKLTPVAELEGRDTTNGTFVQTIMRTYNDFGTSSTTISAQCSSQATNGNSHLDSQIFVLKLDVFRDLSWAYTTTGTNTDTTNAFATSTNMQTTSITPTVTGDCLCLTQTIMDANTGQLEKVRMQVDDADQPAAQTTDDYSQGLLFDDRDLGVISLVSVESLASGSAHPVDIDATSSAARSNIDRMAAVFTMELEPAVAATTKALPVMLMGAI